jgi:hypothetical protein
MQGSYPTSISLRHNAKTGDDEWATMPSALHRSEPNNSARSACDFLVFGLEVSTFPTPLNFRAPFTAPSVAGRSPFLASILHFERDALRRDSLARLSAPSPFSIWSSATSGTLSNLPNLIVGISPRAAAAYALFRERPRRWPALGTVIVSGESFGIGAFS